MMPHIMSGEKRELELLCWLFINLSVVLFSSYDMSKTFWNFLKLLTFE